MKKLDMMKCSTEHLSVSTLEWLAEESQGGQHEFMCRDTGFMASTFHGRDDIWPDSPDVPRDLVHVLRYAEVNGLDWVLFDEYAGPDPKLPLYKNGKSAQPKLPYSLNANMLMKGAGDDSAPCINPDLVANKDLRISNELTSEKAARLLKAHGANAAYIAADNNEVDILEYILECLKDTSRLDVNKKNTSGETLMHHAARANAVDALEWLKSQEATVNPRDNKNDIPMHWAAYPKSVDALEWLIANSTDVNDINAQDIFGNTPMHFAAAGNAVGVMKMLKAKGADINVCNNDDRTPLDNADYMGAGAAIEWLESEGAKRNETLTEPEMA